MKMSSGQKAAALSALVMACAPVASASAATVLFSDDFDAGTSGTRYVAYAQDNDTGAEAPGPLAEWMPADPGYPGLNPGDYDVATNFNFNYGAYTYFYTSADFTNPDLSAFIPQAPRSTGAAKVGLRVEVNNALPTGSAAISLYPKISEYVALPSGDHKLTFDIWMNYTGPYEGNAGSMEWYTAGVNQEGGGIGGLIPVGDPNLAGFAMAANGERTNTLDYRFYRNNTRLGSLDEESGYVAQDEGPGQPGPADGRNQFYQQLFPYVNPNDPNEPWYETAGATGKHWTTVEIKVEDGIVYYYMQPAGAAAPTLVAARTDESVTSGQVMLGYADTPTGVAALEGRNPDPAQQDANFAIFDNVVVETVDQVRPKWNVNANGNWSDAGNWLNGVPNANTATADFTDAISGSGKTVNVDQAQTVRALLFDNSAQSYTLADAGGSINFDSLTTGILGTVKVKSGSHIIAAPINTNRNMWFDAAAGSSLAITGPLNVANVNVRKSGDGSITVKNIRTTKALTVSGGSFAVAPDGTAAGASSVDTLSLASGAKLDLTNNKLIVQTGSAGTATGGVYDGVQGLVQSGYAGGNWNGNGILSSSAAAVPAGEASTAIGVATGAQIKPALASDPSATALFAGQTVTGSSVIAMYTYGGDANLDGLVSGDDYTAIDFAIAVPGASGWVNGDFNYDGIISGDDYTVIDFNVAAQGAPFSTGGAALGATAVPEPASLSVLGLAAAAGLLGRRRRDARRA